MPDLLVHLTLAKAMLQRPGLPTDLSQAAAAAPDALLLGSVLPDLPYHAHFLRQLARHLAGADYLPSEWGDLLHTRGTGRLALAMLAHLARSHSDPHQERRRAIALLAGYLSHHAVDRVVHPAIQQLVKRERRSLERPEPASRTHSRIERYQNLLYHRDLLGFDIVCSPFPRQILSEMAGAGLVRPALDPPLWRAVRAACLETHGRAPSEPELRDWLWGTTAFGALMSSPLARIERPQGGVERVRERYYQGPQVDLQTPLERAQEATAAAWHAASEVLNAERITAEVRQVFLRKVPDVDLGTGA